jgi:hypothetical protein
MLALRSHLDSCRSCSEHFAIERATKTLVRSLRVDAPAADMEERLLVAVAGPKSPATPVVFGPRNVAYALAALAAAAFVITYLHKPASITPPSMAAGDEFTWDRDWSAAGNSFRASRLPAGLESR